MKFKKIYIIGILFAFIFIRIESAFAENKKVSCTYTCPFEDGNKYDISTNIDISNDSNSYPSTYLNFGKGVKHSVTLMNAYEIPNSNCYKSFCVEQPFGINGPWSFVGYHKKSGSCPDYLFIYYDYTDSSNNTYDVGIFLNDVSTATYPKNELTRCENSNPVSTKDNPNPKIEEKENAFTCKYTANVDTGAVKYSVATNLTINSTKKTASSTNSVIFNKEDFFSDSCLDSVYMCVDKRMNSQNSHDIYLSKNLNKMLENLIPIEDHTETKKSFCNSKTDEECLSDFLVEFSYSCNTVYKDKKNDLIVGSGGCGQMNKFIENLENYSNNKQSSSVNEEVDKIKSYCKIILEYSNYTEKKYSCVDMCLNLNNYIGDYINLTSSSGGGECGLSGNLIKWIKNILKWIKYILPVLVIILGIIDFIKAIASGSDDEMKKAQGRFIKRLIAAALLFIIPALIEFILNVFNIESTFCGLTD